MDRRTILLDPVFNLAAAIEHFKRVEIGAFKGKRSRSNRIRVRPEIARDSSEFRERSGFKCARRATGIECARRAARIQVRPETGPGSNAFGDLHVFLIDDTIQDLDSSWSIRNKKKPPRDQMRITSKSTSS
jgi:hypothetical protein